MKKKMDEFEGERAAIGEEQDYIKQELNEKDYLLEQEKDEKNKLEALLSEMNNKLVQGNDELTREQE